MPVDGELHKAAHKGDIEELKGMLGPVEVAAVSPPVAATDTPELVPETPVEEGADEEDDDNRIGVDDMGAQERTALQRACGAGHLECVTYLIQKGADATRPDKAGRTALHWAAIAGHTEVVAHLLATVEAVNVFAATESGITALHATVSVKNTAVLNLLVAKCKEQFKEAAEEEQAAKLQAFFEAPNKEGQSAWDVGVAAKDKELCTALREAGDKQVATSEP